VRATIHDSDHELITICNVCVNSLESPNSLDESHLDKQTAATLASSMMKMTVSTVEKHVQAKSPMVSTANKINAKTAAKKRVNKSREVVSAVKVKEPRIGIGVWVFSTKSQLISLVKQGDPWYENLWSATSNGFWFYGAVLRADTRKCWWHVEYDLFPSDAKIKQNVQYCPLQVIQRVMHTRNRQGHPAGRHAVMKTTICGVNLFLLAYAWSNKQMAYIVSSCGTTVVHEIPYCTHFTDNFGNVTFKDLPHPSIAHFYFELCPLIDNHKKDRQGILGLEDCWSTKNLWFRLITTLIGMSVVDMHRWDRNQRSGGKAFYWMNLDEKRPDFLQVRTMANLIAKELHLAPMQYYDTNTPRPTIPIRNRQTQQQDELQRITDKAEKIR
jgi:hypothetical protein